MADGPSRQAWSTLQEVDGDVSSPDTRRSNNAARCHGADPGAVTSVIASPVGPCVGAPERAGRPVLYDAARQRDRDPGGRKVRPEVIESLGAPGETRTPNPQIRSLRADTPAISRPPPQTP